MSLSKGDHLVIKRDGRILTSDAGESYHEFEVMEQPIMSGETQEDGSYVAFYKDLKLKVIH